MIARSDSKDLSILSFFASKSRMKSAGDQSLHSLVRQNTDKIGLLTISINESETDSCVTDGMQKSSKNKKNLELTKSSLNNRPECITSSICCNSSNKCCLL